MNSANDDGKGAANRFHAVPLEVTLMILDNLSQHELLIMMRTDKMFAEIGKPLLYRRDAKAHNEHSVPEALMFAAMKSKTDPYLARVMAQWSLANGGKINTNNVYKFDAYVEPRNRDAKRAIATQVSLFHFIVVFGTQGFIHLLRAMATPDMCLERPNAMGYGVLDLAKYRFGFDLEKHDSRAAAKYKNYSMNFGGGVRGRYAGIATPLSYALEKDDWEMAEALLSFGAWRDLPYHLWHPTSSSRTSHEKPPATMLEWAAKRTYASHQSRGSLPDSLLIDAFRERLGHQELEGGTFLTAINYGNVSFVRALLQAGVDPNVVGASGRVPLVWACRRHRYYLSSNVQRSKNILECIRALLDFSADPNIESGGETALEFAIGGISPDLDGWDETKALVRLIWSSPMLDIHRVLSDGLTVAQRHAKRLSELSEDSSALKFDHQVLGRLIREGGLIEIPGRPTLPYTAMSNDQFELYQTLKGLGAQMRPAEMENILITKWVPGEQKERTDIEKALGTPAKEFGEIISDSTNPGMAARLYCALADKKDASAINRLMKSVKWPRKSQTMARYALEKVAGFDSKDAVRKLWMDHGFDASLGDSIGLMVLDRLEGAEAFPPTKALDHIKRLFTMGARPCKPYAEGKSAYDRVKQLRLDAQRGLFGNRSKNRYQDMREWFEDARAGNLNRETGEIESAVQDSGAESVNEGLKAESTNEDLEGEDVKMEGAEE